MKKAFSMIELVFAIVVIGILAVTIIPNTRTNPVQEAAIQLLSHIRYTQHLAIVNDKYMEGNLWFRKRWQIAFVSVSSPTTVSSNHKIAYTIYSDSINASTGDADFDEVAKNPENTSQIMTGGYAGSNNKLNITEDEFEGMKKLNLGMSYGITSLTFNDECKVSGSHRLAFDYLGRPIIGKLGGSGTSGNTIPYESNNLLQDNCDITLSNGSQTAVVRIRAETGYASIL
ncbi:MAG: type II secretion system protein [Campylobacterota bacterium]|nr:type II secretion system protein [Campylobacterota bacterium]